jgi:hypothetical protein
MVLKMIVLVALLSFGIASRGRAASSWDGTFELPASEEVVAEVEAAAPGASWRTDGAEASLATISVDGHYNQDIVVFRGAAPQKYHVFLGRFGAGGHTVHMERNSRWSAPGAGLAISRVAIQGVGPRDKEYTVIEHAPIVYARADTIGHFSDVPMLEWYEVFPEPGGGETLQYSIVFSNEDGGTPTDALMARWGRTTDIEYVYRVTLDKNGSIQSEYFLGIDEKPHPFRGRKEADHPLILDATPNNDFTDTGYTPIQYRMRPVFADLSRHSREELMDEFPWTYGIMRDELVREGKLRPFGISDGTKISDPRDYLYVELHADNHHDGLVVRVKVKGDPHWYSSARGRYDLVISRSGWYRTTVELPPGTTLDRIESFALECLDLSDPFQIFFGKNPSTIDESTLHGVSKAFMLNADDVPGRNLFESSQSHVLHPGDMLVLYPAAK